VKAKDIETKRLIFDLGIDKIYWQAKKRQYKGDSSEMDDFKACYGLDFVRVCENLANGRYRRVRTTRNRIWRAVRNGNAYFITLTFTDEVLARTTEKQRRLLVVRFLKTICYSYVANIDFGDKTEREHYHAIVEPLPFCFASWQNGKVWYENMPDLRAWIENYGIVSCEKVGDTEKDEKKVAKYTAKLSAHAIKLSTINGDGRVPRIIYSRRRF